MPDPVPYPVALVADISHRLGQLSEHLAQAPPQLAAQILGTVLDTNEGILGRMTGLMATGSHVARHHAHTVSFPPEVRLALGRAANELHDIALDFDEHADAIRRLATRPTTMATPGPKPVPVDETSRRRR